MSDKVKRVVRDHANPTRIKLEAQLKSMIGKRDGIKAVAARLTNPVKTTVDYTAVMRNCYMIEKNAPAGYDFQYETDLVRTPAVKTAKGAGVYQVELSPDRVTIGLNNIQSTVYVNRNDLFNRTYDVFNRAKQRVAEGLQIREDLILLGLASAAANSTLGHAIPTTAGALSKAVLAKAYQYLEDQNLNVSKTVVRASGSYGMRNFNRDVMDDRGMEELRETGELGRLWGAGFVKTYLLEPGTALTFSDPEYVGTYYVRADQLVDAVDELTKQRVGFVGFHMYGAAIHNAKGVVESQYNENA